MHDLKGINYKMIPNTKWGAGHNPSCLYKKMLAGNLYCSPSPPHFVAEIWRWIQMVLCCHQPFVASSEYCKLKDPLATPHVPWYRGFCSHVRFLESRLLSGKFNTASWKISKDFLVGGFFIPLKNMKVSWDDEIPNIWKVIKLYKIHVPNHQSDIL